MAVAPTGAIYKALEFDGVSSRTYGVYITGEAVYNAPERDVEMIAIPGRNGSFALDKGRFENIEVSYPAGIFAETEADFAEAISNFRNLLCSRRGYVRLQDEYHPDEYRMAVYKNGLEVENALLKAGEFDIVFDCKPQRYLTSGEEPITMGDWTNIETVSGDIVEIDNEQGVLGVKSLSVSLEPIQDLNGYDKPWSGGSGKNKFNVENSTSVNFSRLGGTFTNNVTDTRTTGQIICQAYNGSTYVVSSSVFTENDGRYHAEITISNVITILKLKHNGLTNDFAIYFPWTTQGIFTVSCSILKNDPTTVGGFVITDIMITTDGTYTPYSPYSNICPIYGRTECDTYVSPTTSETDAEVYTTDLGRTVYGGTLEQVGGQLTDEMGYIASYNGEAIGEPWLSDRDEYVAGTTPSIGAEVVYTLATPQTYQLDPQQIDLLLGTNNVWSDGDVTLEYGQDPNVIVNPTLFEASPLIECKGTGNIYLNSDQITINNLPIGDVSLASAKSSSTDSVSSSFNIDNAALLNPGDTITVASGCSTEVSFSWASSVALQSITPTISGTLPGGQVYGSLLSTTSLKCTTTMGAATFAYGTSSYYESTVSVAFEYLQSGTTYTKTCTYKVSCSYDGSNTITLSITNKTGASPFSFTSASACSLKVIKGTSTRLTTTDTIYIDLDIGEAYIINSGTITSINDIVSMPSKLPTIKPGTNTIIYANTITNLKITPRWWKV